MKFRKNLIAPAEQPGAVDHQRALQEHRQRLGLSIEDMERLLNLRNNKGQAPIERCTSLGLAKLLLDLGADAAQAQWEG